MEQRWIERFVALLGDATPEDLKLAKQIIALAGKRGSRPILTVVDTVRLSGTPEGRWSTPGLPSVVVVLKVVSCRVSQPFNTT